MEKDGAEEGIGRIGMLEREMTLEEYILHVKGLSHIHAVQPYLIGVDLLVPKVALLGTRLRLHLTIRS